MKTRKVLLSVPLFFGITLTLVLLWTSSTPAVRASAPTHYVSKTSGCGGQSPCYLSIQAAVNASGPGDLIKVATGTYTGTVKMLFGTQPYTQVVFITRTLTLQGGFTNSNWTSPDVKTNPTVIDAQRKGRGITIKGTGSEKVIIDGFTITGGDYTGFGNPPATSTVCPRSGGDCAGGLYASSVKLLLRNSQMSNNIASRAAKSNNGGGAYLTTLVSGSTIENTTFYSNAVTTGDGTGGGAEIAYSGLVTVTRCTFENNRAETRGGGLLITQPANTIIIEKTNFFSNTLNSGWGGLCSPN